MSRGAEREQAPEGYGWPASADFEACTWSPHDEGACPYCAGTICVLCGAGREPGPHACEHDSFERHMLAQEPER